MCPYFFPVCVGLLTRVIRWLFQEENPDYLLGEPAALQGEGLLSSVTLLPPMKPFRYRSSSLRLIRVCNVKWQGFCDLLGLTVSLYQYLIFSNCFLQKQDTWALLIGTKGERKKQTNKQTPANTNKRRLSFWYHLEFLFSSAVMYQ